MPILRGPSDSPREAVRLLLVARLLLRPIVVWTRAVSGFEDPIGKRSEFRRVGGMAGADNGGGGGGVGSRADAIEHIEFRRVGGMTGALSGADVDGGSGTATPDASAVALASTMAVHGQRLSGANGGSGTGSLCDRSVGVMVVVLSVREMMVTSLLVLVMVAVSTAASPSAAGAGVSNMSLHPSWTV